MLAGVQCLEGVACILNYGEPHVQQSGSQTSVI